MLNQPQRKQTPQRFFKLLQAGDLAFLDFMMYAVVIFGITKHGKTTFAHSLTGHPLQAYKNGTEVHYRLSRAQDKQSDAKIGQTMQSQTQIPNKFSTGIKINQKQELCLIDNPGQKDSFGINRILSNAYFHYRIFSKIQNMKFILLFDYPQFSGKITETNQVFDLFFKSFANFAKVKQSLLKSICIVFSKVDSSKTIADLHARALQYKKDLAKAGHFDQDKQQFIQKLIDQCIKNDKIKVFRKAELNVIPQSNKNLLDEINKKLQFFSRDIDEQGEFESKHYKQKRVSMKNIKFSQSNRVMALSQNMAKKRQTQQLFNQLSQRGGLLFKSLFETISQLIVYLLFDSNSNEQKGNEINQTQIIRQKRSKLLKQIIKKLQLDSKITYDQSQKYQKKRLQIIKSYSQSLKQTQKSQNFIQRLLITTEIYNLCYKFINTTNVRTKQEINLFKQGFQQLIFKVAQFYQTNKQIQILSHFLYNINTFMNQIIIFSMIIVPYAQQNEDQQKKNQITHNKGLDQRLGKFLSSLTILSDSVTKMNDKVQNAITQRFNITKQMASKMDTNLILTQYFKKYPTIIMQQNQNQNHILKLLKNINLSMQHRIHSQILIFKVLQKKYYFLTQLKSLQDKKNQPNTHMEVKQLKILIKSLILYLKSVKKLKQLSQYNQFSSYKQQIYQINYLSWTYLVKLFYHLFQSNKNPALAQNNQIITKKKKRKDSTKKQTMNIPPNNAPNHQLNQQQFYKEILIQILSTSKNYNLIEETFDKLLQKYQKSFSQITMKHAADKVSEQTQKPLNLYGQDSLTYFMNQKKKSAEKIIQCALCYAEQLNSLHLKDKSLIQCYNLLKYTQYCPQQMIKIEDMIKKIKTGNSGLKMQETISFSAFEASLTTRKQLSKFLLNNANIPQLQCVKHQFLK